VPGQIAITFMRASIALVSTDDLVSVLLWVVHWCCSSFIDWKRIMRIQMVSSINGICQVSTFMMSSSNIASFMIVWVTLIRVKVINSLVIWIIVWIHALIVISRDVWVVLNVEVMAIWIVVVLIIVSGVLSNTMLQVVNRSMMFKADSVLIHVRIVLHCLVAIVVIMRCLLQVLK